MKTPVITTKEIDTRQLRLRIADLMGYKVDVCGYWTTPDGKKFRAHAGCRDSDCMDPLCNSVVPFFGDSLNAMHAVELRIPAVKRWNYGKILRGVIQDSTGVDSGWPGVVFAEAWQKAIAYDRLMSEKPLY